MGMQMKTQKRHLVILLTLLCLLGWSKGAHADVYWNFVSGGNGVGDTPATAVKNWSTVISRLQGQVANGQDPWVIVMDTVSLGFSFDMSGEFSVNGTVYHAKLKRYAGFTNSMFILRKGVGGLTLSNVTISGECQGATPHPAGTCAIITMREGTTLTINEGTVIRDNWNYATNGGAVYSSGYATVIMNGGTITGCKSKFNGGAISLVSNPTNASDPNVDKTSSFTMNGGIIEDCYGHFESLESGYGGGIYIAGKQVTIDSEPTVFLATLDLKGGTIRNCTCSRAGGFYAVRTNVILESTEDTEGPEISGNICKYYGGGAYITSSEVTMSAGKVINNTAGSEAVKDCGSGGLSLVHTPLTMSGGTISGNSSGVGGGIGTAYEESIVTISGGTISSNTAYTKGGALNMNVGGSVIIPAGSNVIIEDNHSNMGGCFCIDGAYADIQAGVFRNNRATDAYISPDPEDPYPHGFGGAIYIQCKNNANTHASVVSISGATFANNRATKSGGAIYLEEVIAEHDPAIEEKNSVSISNCTFTGNKALENDGGAIYINDGVLTVAACDIRDNEANVNGGGIYFDGTSTMTVGSGTMTIKDNTGNSLPNNVYLMTGNIIDIASGASFNPAYVGIYPQGTATAGSPIHVFSGTNEQVSSIYRTNYVVDDSQRFFPLNPGSGTTYDFGISPWSSLQQTARATDLGSLVDGYYEISNVKQLTAFLWKVNGIDTYESSFSSPAPGIKGKLMADIDMEDHYWVPIANYTGTFDGNGYFINNLTMVPSNMSNERGMFGVNTSGTIKNVILKDCYFASKAIGSGYVGSIVSQMSGGTLSNSVAQGTLVSSVSGWKIGGITGLLNSGAEVHSCYATPDMHGYAMGGLVGENDGNLYNSFVNARFTPQTGSTDYMGGLVASNTGSVENCYVQLQGAAPASNFGWLVGSNSGSGVKYCYIPEEESPYKATGSDPSGHGTYGTTSLPVLYNHADNQVAIASGANINVPSGTNKQLLVTLNNWVTNNGPSTYTYWLRPWQKDNSSKFINDDLPLLRLPATNAVASSSGNAYLDYNQINDLLGAYKTASDAVCFYGKEASMDGNALSSSKLYIDQEAVLKQSGTGGTISAYVGVALQNRRSSHYQWHMFSTTLQNVPLGVNYTDNAQYLFSWEHPMGMPYWRFYDDAANHGYFPSMDYAWAAANSFVYNADNSAAANNGNYYYDWDYYTYFEPHYHWINFKRNSNSHWHEDDNGATKIPYTNETYLGVGKGYFLSVKDDTYLQAYGTLNDGALGSTTPNIYKVTVTDGITWTNREGFNLVGNPYQSYLDFDAFASANRELWNSDPTKAYYYIIDGDAYTKYVYSASTNPLTAPRLIHPHQGFFIVADNAAEEGTALVFNDDMRDVTGTNVAFRNAGQPSYPLVNLIATDDEGKRDIATVELNRPDKGGAKVMDNMRVGKGIVYCHYEDEDYAIAFTQPGISEVGIRFETAEDAPFTMTWDTENGEFHYLHLIDNMTGTDIDCLTKEEYKFTAKATDYKSRFRLVFGYTGIDDQETSETAEGSVTFAFLMGDELVVNGEGKLQLFDMSGRMLMETQVEGTQSTLGLPELASGIYLLRLGDRINGTRTQKIVIR